MRIRSVVQMIAATALVAAPVAASAAPVANPAASLSLAPNARAAAPASHANGLAGGVGLFGLLIVAGIVAIVAVSVVKDDEKAKSP